MPSQITASAVLGEHKCRVLLVGVGKVRDPLKREKVEVFRVYHLEDPPSEPRALAAWAPFRRASPKPMYSCARRRWRKRREASLA